MTAPLVLLPIRIETAFFDRELVIRVYPDDAHLDRRAPARPPGESRPKPPVRPRWLPDRWVATGWRAGQRVFLVEGRPIDAEHLAVSPDLGAAEPDRDMRWMSDVAEAERVGMALRVTLDVPRLDRLLVFGVRTGPGASELVELLEAHRDSDGLGFLAPGTPTNLVGPETPDPAPTAGGDADRAGARTAASLGAPGAAVLLQAAGADRDEESIARAMSTALWPATWGYFLTNLMTPVEIAPTTLDQVRGHFIQHVRAGGPLPVLRIGAQPYALLPTTSLDRWSADASDLDGLVGLLARLRQLWLAASKRSDSEAALLDAMRVMPRSHAVDARSLVGRRFVANLFAFLQTPDLGRWNQQQEQLGIEPLVQAGLGWKPRIAHAVFDGDSIPLRGPFVAPLEKGRGGVVAAVFAVNYVTWLRDATVEELRAQVKIPRTGRRVVVADGMPGPGARIDASAAESCLFYSVLRHATLRAYADAAMRLMRARTQSSWPFEIEPELTGPGWSSGAVETIWNLFAEPLPRDHRTPPQSIGAWLHSAATPDTALLAEHRASLTALATQPPAALERHFAGALDLCAYRLDAWITSVATRRLAALRARDPQGLQLGAYGWVEDLAPRDAALTSDGFILAPSPAQAATAALLRNGYRSRKLAGNTDDALAIDLSSERARTALNLLDGVRSGMRLGEQLGAMLERALHDAGLDRFIARFRAAAPAHEGTLVDGDALLETWRSTRDVAGVDWGGQRDAVAAHLDRLVDALDAVGDLAVAEGVHQAMRGNMDQSSAIFDALGRGEQPPPETSVMGTPRSAVRHTARLLIGLPPRQAPDPRWPTEAHAVRGQLAPELDAWAGDIIGDPRQVRVRAVWSDDSGVVGRRELQLAQLGLSALDVVYLADHLDAWLLELADRDRPAGVPAAARVALDRTRVETSATIDEALALARAVRAVLDRARPACAADFAMDVARDDDPARLLRAREARDLLQQRIDAAVASTSAATIRAISAFGVAGADRDAVIAVARTRVAAANNAADATAMFAAVFGASFPAPAVTQIPQAARQSFATRGDRDSDGVKDWISAIARVREAAGRLEDLMLLADALGRACRFELAQVPDQAGQPPVFAAEARAIRAPRLALATYAPAPLGDAVAALVVDEWVESLPSSEQTAGIGFHFDRPGAEPPQAILLAVPPDVNAPWTSDAIESVLRETLDLAAMRSVAPESLGAVAQIVPASVFAFNAAGDAISTDFTPLADQ